jgi:hypothetical protein
MYAATGCRPVGLTLETLADGSARNVNEVALLEHLADLELLPRLVALRLLLELQP